MRNGAKVHVLDASQQNVDDFSSAFPDAFAAKCDVSDAKEIEAAFEHLDRLDVLVNNAGIAGPAGKVETLDTDAWNRCVDVNLNGTFYATRQAVPLLRQSDTGTIINIASNAGLMGCPDRSPYAATKWAIIGLTKTWAMELGPQNIRVNAVCPTSVEGKRIDNVIARDAKRLGKTEDEIRDIYERQSSMRTFVSAEDVADVVTFLASAQASRISGQVLAVDGHTETLAVWTEES